MASERSTIASGKAGAVVSVAIEGNTLTEDERVFLQNYQPAGVTLFKRNLDCSSREQASLIQDIQSTRAGDLPPLIISIDQEGGRVNRLRPPFPNLGPAEKLADGRDDVEALDFLSDYGRVVGASLRGIGVNVNFAPVVDVLTNPQNNAIGDRVFGTDPQIAARRAGAFLNGMQAAGVFGCLKHFPGQGDADVDTHEGSAQVDISLEELLQRELVPFQQLLSQVELVMIAHVVYPQLDGQPASLSKIIMQDLLQKQLGYKNIIVSDDMVMGAIPQTPEEFQNAIIGAISAGADLLLVCRGLDKCRQAIDAIAERAKDDSAFAARLKISSQKVTAFRQKLALSLSK